jgi:nitroreductase
MTETVKNILQRFSCRGFTPEMPTEEQFDIIAKAALAAPSGMNRQLWRVVILKNKELIDELEAEGLKNMRAIDKTAYDRIVGRGGKLFYGAPAMIVVSVTPATPKGAELFDCGILAQNVVLAAESKGLNTCMCGLAAYAFAGSKREEFNRRLGFPEGYEIGMAILVGHGAVEKAPHELDFDKVTVIN